LSVSSLEEDAESASPPLDSLVRRRSPATVPGYLAGRPPRSKGRRYPADPPRTEEIIAVMRGCGDGVYGFRARGLIVVLWRAGLTSALRADQLRRADAHALELAHEGVPLNVIPRQVGPATSA
jgi:hypothetical protein